MDRTAAAVQEISLDGLERGLKVSYGEDGRAFTIQGREIVNFCLKQFSDMRKKECAEYEARIFDLN